MTETDLRQELADMRNMRGSVAHDQRRLLREEIARREERAAQ